MSKTIYIAPIKGDFSLGEMVKELNKKYGKGFDGCVVTISGYTSLTGLWELVIGREPPARILHQYSGIVIKEDVLRAIEERGLIIADEIHGEPIVKYLQFMGYSVEQLDYHS